MSLQGYTWRSYISYESPCTHACKHDSITSNVDAPSVLHALSPQNLLLGTDTGRLHVYDLRAPSTLSHNARPARTLQPHATPEVPTYSEPLTSLTPLPPNASSTSGTSRTWVTTSGFTLAVTDLRKGVVKVSEDQGDVLLSSTCVPGLGMSKKRRRLMEAEATGGGDKVLVGGAGGILTLFDRGQWEDQSGRVVVHRGAGGDDDDSTIDALAVLPGQEGHNTHVVAAGMGTGEIKFIRLRGGGGSTIGSVGHDETGVEGVSTLGFDVYGRLISGGGEVVKVWRRNTVSNFGAGSLQGDEDVDINSEEGHEDDEDQGDGIEDESRSSILGEDTTAAADDPKPDDEDEDDDSEEEPAKPKKRKKRSTRPHARPHGITAFTGMD